MIVYRITSYNVCYTKLLRICYTIIDFEDGINLGLIDEDYALEFLVKLVQNSIDRRKYNELKTKEDRISYLRALAIGSLINDAVHVFLANEEKILKGEFSTSLMDKSKYKAQMDDIIEISVKKVYQSKEVVEKEIVGYNVINGLLTAFCEAYYNKMNGNRITSYNVCYTKLLRFFHKY